MIDFSLIMHIHVCGSLSITKGFALSITQRFALLFTVYCFCREMRSPGGSCFPLCNLLKNSVTSGVILKVNMSLFGCKLFSICVNRSQKCRNVHSQGVYLIMS